MYKLKVVLFVLSCFTFATCKKIYYKTTIKGVFWDYCGEQGLSGYKIKLIEGCECGGKLEYKEIAEVLSDINGVFDFGSLKLDKRSKKFYKVYAVVNSEKDSLSKGLGGNVTYPNIKNIESWFPKANYDNYDTLRLCSYINGKGGYIRLNYIPTDDLDSIYVERYHKVFNLDIYKYSFSSNFFKSNPNGFDLVGYNYSGSYHYKFKIRKNGVYKTYEDDIYAKWKHTPPFDYTIVF
ncbi:MAG: hypothetical protein V4667_13585 [Bacteroidota bacterium]